MLFRSPARRDNAALRRIARELRAVEPELSAGARIISGEYGRGLRHLRFPAALGWHVDVIVIDGALIVTGTNRRFEPEFALARGETVPYNLTRPGIADAAMDLADAVRTIQAAVPELDEFWQKMGAGPIPA